MHMSLDMFFIANKVTKVALDFRVFLYVVFVFVSVVTKHVITQGALILFGGIACGFNMYFKGSFWGHLFPTLVTLETLRLTRTDRVMLFQMLFKLKSLRALRTLVWPVSIHLQTWRDLTNEGNISIIISTPKGNYIVYCFGRSGWLKFNLGH